MQEGNPLIVLLKVLYGSNYLLYVIQTFEL